MSDFLNSADSRATSPEIMRAIYEVAGGDDAEAAKVWEEPDDTELRAVFMAVAANAAEDPRAYRWGAAGHDWALGLEFWIPGLNDYAGDPVSEVFSKWGHVYGGARVAACWAYSSALEQEGERGFDWDKNVEAALDQFPFEGYSYPVALAIARHLVREYHIEKGEQFGD